MAEAEAEAEAKVETWKWEVVKDPAERLRLIETTIAERVRQTLARSIGNAELAAANAPDAKDHAAQSSNLVFLADNQLQAIQRVINLPPEEPLPVDRITYAKIGKAFIVLGQVPKSTPSNPPPQPR